MLNILVSILFGIVEGITEWLPISSTGHMILLDEFVHLNVSKEFYSMYEVVIQLGAIMAVVVIYWWKIWPFYIWGNKKGKGQIKKSKKDLRVGKVALSTDAFFMWVKIVVACLPAIVYGLVFDDKVEEIYASTTIAGTVNLRTFTVAAMLIIVGILFIVVEKHNQGKEYKVNSIGDITYKMAIIIGIWQMFAAMLPGTSRSGSTIIGAMLLGVSRVTAAEFTFYLAIPVMFGASLLKILKFGLVFTTSELVILLVGMLTAFLVSYVAIRTFIGYIKKNSFTAFGIYRIVLGALVLIYFLVFKVLI
ncbi:MAG: undecaprenyl-diphosphate phosphatase [Erysipelotrichaceae bacterium]|nr:undecaprenyl-diphosphate phosphatase [Erysipelotrichaceae bacterium]